MTQATTTIPIWAVELKKIRRREGLSQAQFGSLFRVTQQAVALWEQGTRPPVDVLAWVVAEGGVIG